MPGRKSVVRLPILVASVLVLGSCSVGLVGRSTGSGGQDLTGEDHGAIYRISVPTHWNRVLLVYSHGYIASSSPGLTAKFKKAGRGPDPDSVTWLLAHGYALAASLYGRQGWAVRAALTNQAALVDLFKRRVGSPLRVIAWGSSMGGLISVGLAEEYPDRFSAALPMCGNVAGSIPTFDAGLDAKYVIKALLAPSSALQLSTISDPARDQTILSQVIQTAQSSASGRARLALAAAMLDLPSSPGGEAQQQRWIDMYWVPQLTYGVAQVVQLGSGNPTSNVDINYPELLKHSVDRSDVEALYRQAGISLGKDLTVLNNGSRVHPDPGAVAYYTRYYAPTGRLTVPVLTLHDTGDPRAVVEQERVYADRVRAAGAGRFVRQLFVHRNDHCDFTAAERLAALQALLDRLQTGRWGNLSVTKNDHRAQSLGPSFNRDPDAAPPAYIEFTPAPLARS